MVEYRRKKPNQAVVAMEEAAGKRLIYIDDEPCWVDGMTFTPAGGKPIVLEPARITGTDGADSCPKGD